MIKNSLKDEFGRSFILIRKSQSSAHSSQANPISFNSDPISVENFVRRLRAPVSYWHFITKELGLRPGAGREAQKQLIKLIVQQRLQFVDVSELLPAQKIDRQIGKTAKSKRVELELPLAHELSGSRDSKQRKTFKNSDEAVDYLEAVKLDENRVKELVGSLGLSNKVTSPTRSSNTDIQALADALASEDIFLFEREQPSAPPKASESAPIEEVHTRRAPSLGPHELGNPARHNSSAKPKLAQVPETEEEPVCTLSQFEFACSHSKRGINIDVLGQAPEINGTPGLQVVCKSNEPDKLKLISSGSCKNGNSNCPEIQIRDDNGFEKNVKGNFSIPAVPKKRNYSQEPFTTFWRKFLLPKIDSNLDYNTYRLNSRGCCSDIPSKSAVVHAFSHFKWSGEVSLGYSADNLKSDSGVKWGLGGKIDFEQDNEKWNYEAKKDITLDSFFPNLQRSMDQALKFFSDIGDKNADSLKRKGYNLGWKDHNDDEMGKLVTYSFTPPAVKLGGGLELKEVDGKNEVGIEGKISLALDPLIKAEIKTDLMLWLILAAANTATAGASSAGAARFGNFLAKAKAWAKKKGVVLELMFTASGEIKANLEWQKNASDTWQNGDGNSAGELALLCTLKAEVSAETHIWKATFKAGAILLAAGSASSGQGIGFVFNLKGTTADDKPALDGTVGFTGVTIYYTFYAEAGLQQDESSDKEGGSKPKSRGVNKKTAKRNNATQSFKRSLDGKWEFVESKTWLEDKTEPRSLDQASV